MARQRSERGHSRRAPARTPEARELELASAAYDLAEDQIKNGIASSQVITHFLKAGSMRERLEHQSIRHDIELKRVKAEQLEGQKRVEELYVSALEAMRSYSGLIPEPESDDGDPQ
jgi:hypothetical protein